MINDSKIFRAILLSLTDKEYELFLRFIEPSRTFKDNDPEGLNDSLILFASKIINEDLPGILKVSKGRRWVQLILKYNYSSLVCGIGMASDDFEKFKTQFDTNAFINYINKDVKMLTYKQLQQELYDEQFDAIPDFVCK